MFGNPTGFDWILVFSMSYINALNMILVAESGSTKTDWRWIRADRSEFGWQTVGINPFYQSQDSVAEVLERDVFPQITEAPEAVYYYGTGLTGEPQKQTLEQLFHRKWPSTRKIVLESDVLGAARALFGDGAGLAAILGTGSNSARYAEGKLVFQVPPLGFWLGDEGSGGHLGKQLVLAYLHREMSAGVRTQFEAQFGAFDRTPILEAAYQKPFPNRYFAQYTPFIQAHITDPFLENLVIDSFTLFFEKYLMKYPQTSPLGFVGSVAHYFRPQLEQVAQTVGLDIQNVLAAPLDALVRYHVNHQ